MTTLAPLHELVDQFRHLVDEFPPRGSKFAEGRNDALTFCADRLSAALRLMEGEPGKPRMMQGPKGAPHEECPDCRGVCTPVDTLAKGNGNGG